MLFLFKKKALLHLANIEQKNKKTLLCAYIYSQTVFFFTNCPLFLRNEHLYHSHSCSFFLRYLVIGEPVEENSSRSADSPHVLYDVRPHVTAAVSYLARLLVI